MDVTHNPINASIGIFYQPNRVFAKLSKTANWSWVPFILVMIFVLTPLVSYLGHVDLFWLRDIFVTATSPDVSPAEIENNKAMMTPDMLKYSMIIGAITTQLIFNLLMATYLKFATRSDEQNIHGFSDWFGVMWWVSMPAFLSCIATLLVLWSQSSDQILLEVLNPLSLNFYLGLDYSSSWLSVVSFIRADIAFMVYLLAVAISQYTAITGRKAWMIASTPFIIIFSLLLFGALTA